MSVMDSLLPDHQGRKEARDSWLFPTFTQKINIPKQSQFYPQLYTVVSQ